MTDLRTAAQQALEALERYQVKRQDFDRFADEITALRAALAAPVQDWDEIEALRESLREHMAEIHRLRAELADHVGGANEVVYQISMKDGAASSAWIDVDEAAYNSAKLYGEYKCRILYTGEKNG